MARSPQRIRILAIKWWAGSWNRTTATLRRCARRPNGLSRSTLYCRPPTPPLRPAFCLASRVIADAPWKQQRRLHTGSLSLGRRQDSALILAAQPLPLSTRERKIATSSLRACPP